MTVKQAHAIEAATWSNDASFTLRPSELPYRNRNIKQVAPSVTTCQLRNDMMQERNQTCQHFSAMRKEQHGSTALSTRVLCIERGLKLVEIPYDVPSFNYTHVL